MRSSTGPTGGSSTGTSRWPSSCSASPEPRTGTSTTRRSPVSRCVARAASALDQMGACPDCGGAGCRTCAFAGPSARRLEADLVVFDCAAFLNKGAEVHSCRSETLILGSRRFIAGLEAALVGMREGGYRKVRISPHLAYGAAGVEGKVPPNAVLVYELWLKSVQKSHLTPKS